MEMSNEPDSAAERWVSYQENLRVFDCTIRDGGLMNDSHFSDEVVKGVYDACVASGIDYMEMGYKNSKKLHPRSEFGPWRHCDEEDLRRIVGDNDTNLKLTAMADAEKSDYQEDILPASESVLDMIRVATYIHQIPVAIDMLHDAHEKGYDATVNLMAVSVVQERELDEGLELLMESPASVIYVVDSFGALYGEQVQDLVERYSKFATPAGKQVGIHAHNNQQLAYANTIEGIIHGATMLDASMAGLGRGAGNCPLELIVGFLHNPKFRLRPILECIQNTIEPMRKELMWGFGLPYMLTGFLNQHPRSAIAFNASDDKGDVVKFYDDITADE
ncbi:MAG: aldolase catalytic domain-containing protein [Candidatus Latescibacteria bacterium]|jgi:4-hydroxy 2-oxovalerate aldolase|nr:aldolase catalytic domain-containing protein [Candidatus Latescibacterota bacterium]